MSIFTGDLWSRWVGLVSHVTLFCTCFRAVSSPAKLSHTQRTRVNFQRLFMMVAVPLFLPKWFVWLWSESGALEIWKYILFVLHFQAGAMSGWALCGSGDWSLWLLKIWKVIGFYEGNIMFKCHNFCFVYGPWRPPKFAMNLYSIHWLRTRSVRELVLPWFSPSVSERKFSLVSIYYLLSSETTAKGTGLAETVGKEDPVEFDSQEVQYVCHPIQVSCLIVGDLRRSLKRHLSAILPCDLGDVLVVGGDDDALDGVLPRFTPGKYKIVQG